METITMTDPLHELTIRGIAGRLIALIIGGMTPSQAALHLTIHEQIQPADVEAAMIALSRIGYEPNWFGA
jgi:hypothetical protein